MGYMQEIADMVGVSRTTVSNVIHGHTKKVSQKTIDKVTKAMKERGYVPNMASLSLSGEVSKIIGVVIYSFTHGMPATQDMFVGEFLGAISREAESKGYYIMLIGGEDYDNVAFVASAWNMDGLIILGYSEDDYQELKKRVNKKMILIDAYPKKEYTFQNVGIDDYSGGYQVGEYLYTCGYPKAVMVAEAMSGCDINRWMGFKKAMEERGDYCSKLRFLKADSHQQVRFIQYGKLLPRFLEAGAVAFTSDYLAIEAMNYFIDRGIKIPEQISIVGFDDNMYATLVRPKLTTVHQDVSLKASIAFSRLLQLIEGKELSEMCICSPVQLVKRESVKMR